ncbi:cyanamide hydratase family HD domain-containing protein [Talaromyces proteolyticus]|uniref:Cyanamide hydratase family HD domain-containing protein n=1 Tax=Talaromyces proteolyticus TaxID=1131652 RepID=A0AAD4PW09_9EURO|nr:cyanamide hydratase family HD domain-containing protein [Talaromyces proteolyticus]KAH8697335.1 cyanamide hydratase family HD domain-containing protein [Talaromyces proteolyticus]
MSGQDTILEYGYTAVPASAKIVVAETTPKPSSSAQPFALSSIPTPNTALAKRIHNYAKSHLPEPTFNHSLRVYHYGLAIKKYRFPTWSFSDETYLLACLLHDIGTTEENLAKTRMSFEFYGGFLALEVLQSRDADDNANAVAPREQAESVAESIIRHQDLCEVGKITAVGQLLQLATIFDNTGSYADLVHLDTIEAVTKAYPRLDWKNCFAKTIRKEIALKPWAHTTALGEEDFPAKVLGNTLMAPYE